MIVEKVIDNDVKRIGDISENRVAIDIANVDFITTLLTSNLYEHPFESFLRETVANAWDSHIEAKNTNHPILILIQAEDNKTCRVSIRDYGTGLSPERFSNIYRNIGSSTKRDNNDFIGCLGIGRFSGLSVAPQLRITSYYNNKKYSYIMYKNGTGINIDLLNENNTDQPNGLEVSISTKLDNYTLNYALKQVQCFPNIIVKAEELHNYNYYFPSCIRQFNERKVLTFDNFSIIDKAYNSCFARMGNIIYPYECDNIGYEHKFKTVGVILNVPMGSVDITPNRETLQLTVKTKNALNNALAKAKLELESLCKDYTTQDFESFNSYEKAIINQYIPLDIKGSRVNVSIRDVSNIDFNNCSIKGKKVPANFAIYIDKIRYKVLDKKHIYKFSLNVSRGCYNALQVVVCNPYNTCKIVLKDDRIKSKTLEYFKEVNKGNNYLIYTKNNWEVAKEEIFKNKEYKDCYNYLEKFITIEYLKDSDVPKDYSVTTKEKISTIRVYNFNGSYTVKNIEYVQLLENNLYIIGDNSKEDEKILKDLKQTFKWCDLLNINFLSIKRDKFEVFSKRKNCILLEDFITKKYNIIRKAIEFYLLNKQQNEITVKNNVRVSDLPIRTELIEKYHKYRNIEYTDIFGNLIQLYQDNNWLDISTLKYFSITEDDIKDYKVFYNIWNKSDLLIKLTTYKKLKHRNDKMFKI